ncbi:MAG: hypothetical protein WBB28_02050 [Crinalium sp.]
MPGGLTEQLYVVYQGFKNCSNRGEEPFPVPYAIARKRTINGNRNRRMVYWFKHWHHDRNGLKLSVDDRVKIIDPKESHNLLTKEQPPS